MDNMITIHTAAQVLGCAFCFLEMLYIFIENREKISLKRLHRLYFDNTLILFLCGLSLLANVFLQHFSGAAALRMSSCVQICHVFYFIFNYILIFTFTDYMIQYTQFEFSLMILGRKIYWDWIVGIITIIASLNVAFSPLTKSLFYYDSFHRFCQGPLYKISHFYGIIVFIIDIIFVCYNWKKKASRKHKVGFYIALPILAILLQIFLYGFTWIYFIMLLALLLIIVNQQYLSERRAMEHNLVLAKKEKELNEFQMNLAISQIQPHFLYNSLNSIGYLCKKDANLAAEAVDRFSNYLRMNLDSFSMPRMIAFEKEMNHTKTYLWLEQMRFGDRLHVLYDIQVEDFALPALSLQPIVENSVKHGICKKPKGGTIRISTRDEGSYHVICVEDDGVGFDSNQMDASNGHISIGLKNVSLRIKDMCNGQVECLSQKGKGCRVNIRLPKEEQEEAYECIISR